MIYIINARLNNGGTMNNPNAPYPGRQLFLGMTVNNSPCFAYLITGRSPESRERKAVAIENAVRIGPLGDTAYDPLRHYNAVKYDNHSGTISVSNGIQTEAIFETYRLLFNTTSIPNGNYMENIMEGAGAEPDSYLTPRIAGVITSSHEKSSPIFIIGIKAFSQPAKTFNLSPKPGAMTGISTYKGPLDNPEARDPSESLPEVIIKGSSAEDIAKYIFDISSSSYKGNDIRVCSVGGVRSSDLTWNLFIINAH
jgi:IMP cyclohydrolase